MKLFPQGYSALALYPEYLKDEPSVLLIDIGGWTVDLMRLDNAVPNASTCRSLELGVIRCMDEILEQVRRNTGLSVTETQIERVLNGQSCSIPVEVVSLIEKQGRIYIEKYCLRLPRQALICGQFLPFSWEAERLFFSAVSANRTACADRFT